MRVFGKVSASLFPIRRCRKPGAGLLLLFFLLALTGSAAFAQATRRVVVPRAARVELSHLGIHTHADFLLFDTGALDVAAMQRDTARFPLLTLRGHSRLDTDHAALPPEWQGLAAGDAPLANPYGPIDGQGGGGERRGKPGWAALPLTQKGRHGVKVLVPTRFANWVALQSKARRRRYLDPRNYSLEIRWAEAKSQP